MLKSDLIRQLLFIYYTVKPFRFSMILNQILKRTGSLLTGKRGFRVIDLAIGYDCNLTCGHCSAKHLKKNKNYLSLEDYKSISRQAENLDNLSFNITGGEPLLSPILDDLILILKPAKHYISIQTNGSLLTRKRAGELSDLGVNCITTSLDSVYPDVHNRFRGSKVSFDQVIRAVKNAKMAGMQALVGGTVTHENIRSSELESLIRLVNGLGAIFLFNLAVPCGNWAGNESIVIQEKDRIYLRMLLDRYPATSTDHEPGRNAKGCPAAMEKIYITPYGDVLPCPFIHISFGNVRTEPLAGIVDRMQRVPLFKGYPDICVAAEDKQFHNDILPVLTHTIIGDLPVDYSVFDFEGDICS